MSLEAVLYGQLGFFEEDMEDEYFIKLKTIYLNFKNKYSLIPNVIPLHFFRMRPNNFPTIRIAQLAKWLSKKWSFSEFLLSTVEEWMDSFQTIPSIYWEDHYVFGEKSTRQFKSMGLTFILNIISNTLLPCKSFYQEKLKVEMRVDILAAYEKLQAEKNSVIVDFEKCGLQFKTRFDTHSILYMKKNYCDEKRCLDCAIGLYWLRQNK